MRTEITHTKVYSVEDILRDDSLKEKVIDNWRETTWQNGDFHWMDEIHDSHNAFKNSLPELEYELEGLRLRTWITNNYLPSIEKGKYLKHLKGYIFHPLVKERTEYETGKFSLLYSNVIKEISCPFTGYVADMEFLQPILDFVEKPDGSTWEELIDSEYILHKLIEREQEWQTSEEYILETIEANQYEFNEDGSIH